MTHTPQPSPVEPTAVAYRQLNTSDYFEWVVSPPFGNGGICLAADTGYVDAEGVYWSHENEWADLPVRPIPASLVVHNKPESHVRTADGDNAKLTLPDGSTCLVDLDWLGQALRQGARILAHHRRTVENPVEEMTETELRQELVAKGLNPEEEIATFDQIMHEGLHQGQQGEPSEDRNRPAPGIGFTDRGPNTYLRYEVHAGPHSNRHFAFSHEAYEYSWSLYDASLTRDSKVVQSPTNPHIKDRTEPAPEYEIDTFDVGEWHARLKTLKGSQPNFWTTGFRNRTAAVRWTWEQYNASQE